MLKNQILSPLSTCPRGLDEEQRKAAAHLHGPALVVAGPGCGKTTVMIERIRLLMENSCASPSQIVALTFTRLAAQEMRERASATLPLAREVFFGTFHSFFLRLLKTFDPSEQGRVISNREAVALLRECIVEQKEKISLQYPVLRQILAQFSMYQNTVSLREKEDRRQEIFLGSIQEPLPETFFCLLKSYQEKKATKGLVDYDDMMHSLWTSIHQHSKFLKEIQTRYRYFCIDEYHDINCVQKEIVDALVGAQKNLFAVGDEDQSIYRFRGAQPDVMLQFFTEYPDAKRYEILHSYRCPTRVVAAANQLIAHNQKRFPKSLVAQSNAKGKIYYEKFDTETAQAHKIAQILRKDPSKWPQTMLLYRMNRQAISLVQALSERNIEFSMRDFQFLAVYHFIFQDIQAYLQASVERSWKAFLKIQHRPFRMLEIFTESVFQKEMQTAKGWSIHPKDRFFSHLQALSRQKADQVVSFILQELGYEGFLKQQAKKQQIDFSTYQEILDLLQDTAATQGHAKEVLARIEHLQKLQKETPNSDTGVLLTTFHGCKGLERNSVFLTGINEDWLPHKNALEEALEEERRLFYVGLTRSRYEVFISSLATIKDKPARPSRFIREAGLRIR